MNKKTKFYQGLPEEEIIQDDRKEYQTSSEKPCSGAFSSQRDLEEYLDYDLFKN